MYTCGDANPALPGTSQRITTAPTLGSTNHVRRGMRKSCNIEDHKFYTLCASSCYGSDTNIRWAGHTDRIAKTSD
jgi:hypothetical protein